MRRVVMVSVLCIAACGDDARPPIGLMDSGSDDGGAGADAGGGRDTGGPVVAQDPGSACGCDADCRGDDAHPGVCVFGICMTRATADCSAAGSAAECATGSRCWTLSGGSDPLCWPDCASFTCAGECDGDGSCVPPDGFTCNPTCGSFCPADGAPCSPDNPTGPCETAGDVCVSGSCMPGCSPSSPTGFCPPGSECTDGACRSTGGCPDWRCTTGCSEIIAMPGSDDPRSPEAMAAGYYIATEARYAYLRRDLTLILQHAACEVANRFPGTSPLGLSDLSQADGMTPGVDAGRARHPTSTHRGSDLDIAYYQTDGTNNPQIICGDGSDRNPNGRPGTYNDGYFCTTEMNIVDWERQAYFFAKMGVSPMARVFGIDQTLADDFRTHLDALMDGGEITAEERTRGLRLGYGDAGGWAFHHHHTHMSYCPTGRVGPGCD